MIPDYRSIRVPDWFIDDGCTLAPDGFMFLGNIRPVCRVHDWLYALGGREEERAVADLILKQGIISLGHGKPIWVRIQAWQTARVYYHSVRLMGGFFFVHDPDLNEMEVATRDDVMDPPVTDIRTFRALHEKKVRFHEVHRMIPRDVIFQERHALRLLSGRT